MTGVDTDRTPLVRALIIGLDADYRGRPLEEQLTSAGVPWRRVAAFDARSLTATELAEYVDQRAAAVVQHRALTGGEVGCAVSHRAAWNLAAENTDPWTLIFEDDARLTEGFDRLGELLVRLPVDGPALLLLNAYPDYSVVRKETVVRDGAAGAFLGQAAPPPLGAAAYAANHRAVALAVERSSGRVASVADWPAVWAYDAAFFVAYPWLATIGSDAPSTLQGDRSTYEVDLAEPRVAKLMRHVEAATCVRYLRLRRYYTGFPQFWAHEVARPVRLWRARRRGVRLVPRADAPWLI